VRQQTSGLVCAVLLAITAHPWAPVLAADTATPVDRAAIKASFDEGSAALAAGHYEVAAGHFERVLQLDPAHDRARLDLGRAYYALGRHDEAREAFSTVLTHNPPDTVKANIQLFLDRIEQESRRFTVNFRLSAGVLYDDNVNVGPASDLIRIRPTSFGGVTIDTLSVAPDTQPKESWGLFGEASVYGQYDAGAKGDWFLTGGADYYQTFLDQHTDREVLYGDVFAGMARLSSKRLLNLPARVAHIEQGSDDLVDIYGIAPSYNVACGNEMLCSTALIGEYRDYARVDERDSFYTEARQQVTRLFSNRSKSITAALGGFYEDADSDVNSNVGLLAHLGGSISLPWKMRFDVRGGYRGSWYDEQEALAPDDREDTEWQAYSQLSKQFDENWSMALQYQYTTRESNFDLYDYDRNFVALRATCAY
jgi:tetratricopeptide (TPR) repeat protein